MPQNIVEALRKASVDNLFRANGFTSCFNVWSAKINEYTPSKTPRQILDIGDKLSEIFSLTKTEGRSQSDVSGGGSAWESFVCWYLNLSLIGRRTVVIKHHRDLIPTPVSEAITVNYNNFVSNTESDLIAITFPDRQEYHIPKEDVSILDENGLLVLNVVKGKTNMKPLLNALAHRDFSDLESKRQPRLHLT